MDRERKNYVAAWIEKAEQDLLAASIILDSGYDEKPYGTVCFHCQQAAEKYLKAYLVFLDVMFPKTHNIGQLIQLGVPHDELGPFHRGRCAFSLWRRHSISG